MIESDCPAQKEEENRSLPPALELPTARAGSTQATSDLLGSTAASINASGIKKLKYIDSKFKLIESRIRPIPFQA